jgi:multiple sugar transport system substrate-binding protein
LNFLEALMSRPNTEPEYRASILPRSVRDASFSRRGFLSSSMVAGAAVALPALLSACGGGSKSTSASSATSAATSAATSSGGASTTSGGATSASGTVTFGSNYSDPSTKAAFAALAQQATAATGAKVKTNTVDHNTFQNNINSYLQGTPDDLFTWFAGYRMQFFAGKGLASPLDDVWAKIGGNFNDATKALSKGKDGHYYFVPIYNYPWVVFYNKSTFRSKGYTVPTTWDQFIALAKKMKTDGLIPIAFADKDLWPALGMFDIINLRVNGYDYHMSLMQHKTAWTDAGVTQVFNQWAQLMPYLQPDANGRIWQDAATTLENKKAGMMFQGTNQVAANYNPKNLPDLDFFPFPTINTKYGQDYMDAPADGFMMSKKPKNKTGAEAVLEYIGSGAAEAAFLKSDKWDVGLATNISKAPYDAIQKKSASAIAACKAVSQFGDRDTDPGFASNVLEPAIQKFIANPSTSNIKSLQSSIEAQAKTIFTS